MNRKSLDRTLGFLRALDRTASAEDVGQLLVAEFADLGIEHVITGRVPNPGVPSRQQRTHVLLTTYPPDWLRRYLARGYVYHDPTIARLGTSAAPFSWGDVHRGLPAGSMGRRVMDEAGAFGLCEGETIPLLTLDGETAAFNVSGRRLAIDPADRSMLHLIATYTFGHLLLLGGEGGPQSSGRLAPREREALQWAAEGKTDWEIGEVMGISTHGVDFHLRSARTKLGTTNRTQAVAIALRRGLIV